MCGRTHEDVCLAAKIGGRCARLGVTAVTKELKRARTEGGRAPEGGSLRAEAGSVGGGGRGAVRIAPEPERVTVRLGRQWVCAPGACAAGNRRAGSAPRVRAPTPSLRTAGRPGCLSGPSSRPASLSARPPTSPVWVPARPRVPGSRARGSRRPRDLCPRFPATALGRDYGRGVILGLLLQGKSAPSLPQPSFRVRVGRARAATGEGRGLAVGGAHPQPAPRTPQPPRGGRRRRGRGGTGGGLARRAGRGRSRPGGGARGRGPRRPGTFPPLGPGAEPPPPHQLRGPHVAADVTPPPDTSHPD